MPKIVKVYGVSGFRRRKISAEAWNFPILTKLKTLLTPEEASEEEENGAYIESETLRWIDVAKDIKGTPPYMETKEFIITKDIDSFSFILSKKIDMMGYYYYSPKGKAYDVGPNTLEIGDSFIWTEKDMDTLYKAIWILEKIYS